MASKLEGVRSLRSQNRERILVTIPVWLQRHLRSGVVHNQSEYVEEALAGLSPAAWKRFEQAARNCHSPRTIPYELSHTPLARRKRVMFYLDKSIREQLRKVPNAGVFIERAICKHYKIAPYEAMKKADIDPVRERGAERLEERELKKSKRAA